MEVRKNPLKLSRLFFISSFALLFGLVLTSASSFAFAWDEFADTSKIQGPTSCTECHQGAQDIWEGTHHFNTFREMPRSDRAREIADNLGIKRIKTEALCLSCHFTSAFSETGKAKPVAGISCESCHGAGQDWIKVHNDFGAGMTAETETPEHKAKRIEMSEKAGMIRPERMYRWASNCFGCHTVPQEKLVNVGGHPAGSKFELVSWSQGEIRHNVWFSGGADNQMASAEQKRVMYVMGQALDLAFALHGVSKATEEATYAVTMAKRAKAATLRLEKVAELVTVPEINEMVSVGRGADLSLNKEAVLSKAADKVADAAKRFSENHNGSALGAIDSLIPGPDRYRGTPAA